jgi:hypothetical protein
MFDWIKRVLQPKQSMGDPYEQLILEFVAECQRQGRVPKSYDPQTRIFVFGHGADGDVKVQLDNLFRAWLALDQGGRSVVISRFVTGLKGMGQHSALVPEELPDQLMPGIRPRIQIANALLQKWIAGAPPDASNETAWLPFAGDLAACVIQDMPDTMSQMTRANLTFADLSIEQAMSRAMANFRARLPSPIFEPLDRGVFGCNNLEDHQSTLLLEPGKDYALPPVEGRPVALVPSRNLFYLTGSANMPGLAERLDISQTAHRMAYFCSSMILQWIGDRWSEFHFDRTRQMPAAREVSLAQLKIDYDFQKHHQKLGVDIFVAGLMLYQKNGLGGHHQRCIIRFRHNRHALAAGRSPQSCQADRGSRDRPRKKGRLRHSRCRLARSDGHCGPSLRAGPLSLSTAIPCAGLARCRCLDKTESAQSHPSPLIPAFA